MAPGTDLESVLLSTSSLWPEARHGVFLGVGIGDRGTEYFVGYFTPDKRAVRFSAPNVLQAFAHAKTWSERNPQKAPIARSVREAFELSEERRRRALDQTTAQPTDGQEGEAK